MTANDEYIKTRMEEAGKKMGESTHNGPLYEYHKGQFLAFREILKPETYGVNRKKRIDQMMSKWSFRASNKNMTKTPVDIEAYQDIMWILGGDEEE